MSIRIETQTNILAKQGILKYIPSYDNYGTDGVRYCISPTTGQIAEAIATAVDTPVGSFFDQAGVMNPTYWKEASFGGDSSVPRKTIVNISTNTTVPSDKTLYNHYKVDTSSNAVVLTLPPMADLVEGYIVECRRVGSNSFVVQPNGSESIDGMNSLVIPENGFFQLTLSDSEWVITTKEVDAVTGDVTHFIGFYMVDGALLVDIVPSSDASQGNIDTSKYNLIFEEDGSPSWRMLDSSIKIDKVLTQSLVLNA